MPMRRHVPEASAQEREASRNQPSLYLSGISGLEVQENPRFATFQGAAELLQTW